MREAGIAALVEVHARVASLRFRPGGDGKFRRKVRQKLGRLRGTARVLRMAQKRGQTCQRERRRIAEKAPVGHGNVDVRPDLALQPTLSRAERRTSAWFSLNIGAALPQRPSFLDTPLTRGKRQADPVA